MIETCFAQAVFDLLCCAVLCCAVLCCAVVVVLLALDGLRPMNKAFGVVLLTVPLLQLILDS